MAETVSRRHALATLASLAASTPAAALLARDFTPMRLLLSFGTYGLPSHSLEDAIDAVSAAGYRGIEICATADRDAAAEKLNAARRREIRDRLIDRGLQLSSLMTNYRPFEGLPRHHQDLERLKRDCELAHELSPVSPPVIQTVLGGKAWEPVRELAVERIADWVEVAAASETTVAVKPHRGHAMSRPGEAMWLIRQLQTPKRLRMWWDYSHFVFRDMPLEATLAESLPAIAGVAVKDAIRADGKVRFALPGEAGTIDYPTLFRLLQGGDFSGSVCVEVSSHVWRQPEYDPTNALQQSYQKMNQALATQSAATR